MILSKHAHFVPLVQDTQPRTSGSHAVHPAPVCHLSQSGSFRRGRFAYHELDGIPMLSYELVGREEKSVDREGEDGIEEQNISKGMDGDYLSDYG